MQTLYDSMNDDDDEDDDQAGRSRFGTNEQPPVITGRDGALFAAADDDAMLLPRAADGFPSASADDAHRFQHYASQEPYPANDAGAAAAGEHVSNGGAFLGSVVGIDQSAGFGSFAAIA
jgi:hypothetical protein